MSTITCAICDGEIFVADDTDGEIIWSHTNDGCDDPTPTTPLQGDHMYFIQFTENDHTALYTKADGEPISTNEVDMALVYARSLGARFPGVTYQVVNRWNEPIGGKHINGKTVMLSGCVY